MGYDGHGGGERGPIIPLPPLFPLSSPLLPPNSSPQFLSSSSLSQFFFPPFSPFSLLPHTHPPSLNLALPSHVLPSLTLFRRHLHGPAVARHRSLMSGQEKRRQWEHEREMVGWRMKRDREKRREGGGDDREGVERIVEYTSLMDLDTHMFDVNKPMCGSNV